MTIADYIREKLRAFGVTEAQLLDAFIGQDFDGSTEVSSDNFQQVGISMIGILEELLFAPRQQSVNENGFSVSWDFTGLSKYYLWMCRKYGVTPKQETVEALGISMIIDKSDCW